MCQWTPVSPAAPASILKLSVVYRGVVFVADPGLQPAAVELVGPVALLARLAGRTELVDRGRNRSLVEIEGGGDHLPGAVELRVHEGADAFTDVAVDAGDPGVGGGLIRGPLRAHDGVAGGAAELGTVHEVEHLDAGGPEDDDVGERQDGDGSKDLRPGDVALDVVWAESALQQLGGREAGALLLEVPGDEDDDEAEDEHHRERQIYDETHVGVGDDAGEHRQLHEDEAQEGRRRQDDPHPAEAVERGRTDEIEVGADHNYSSTTKNL